VAEAWTTDELIADAREQGDLSDEDSTYSDTKCLLAANRELKDRFVPLIRSIRADYYITHEDQDLVADQEAYQIPSRAATNSVREVVWFDRSDNPIPLTPLPLSDRYDFGQSGIPRHYAVLDDRLLVLPTPSSANGFLRVFYERRPSTLVALTSAQVISAVSLADGMGTPAEDDYVITVATPASFDSITADVVKAQPPFSLAVQSMSLTQDTSTLYGTPNTRDMLPSVGDWLCNEGESVIPQLPVELHPALALAMAVKLLKPRDLEMAAALSAELEEQLVRVRASLAPRQQGRQMKIRSKNSWLRRHSAGNWRGGFGDFT